MQHAWQRLQQRRHGVDAAYAPVEDAAFEREKHAADIRLVVRPARAQDLHAGASSADSQDAGFVYVTAREAMDAWAAAARQLDVQRVIFVPEQSVLAREAGPLHLGDRLLVWLEDRPAAIETVWPQEVLNALMPGVAVPAAPVDDPLAALAGAWLHDGGADLATGPYDLRRRRALDMARMKTLGALAAVLAVALGAQTALSTHAMDSLATRIAGRTAQMPAGTLAAGAREGQMRLMSAALFRGLDAQPGTRLRSLRYEAETATLKATVEFARIGADQQVRDAIAATGLTAEAGDLRTEGNVIVGDIRILEGAP